MTEKEYFERYFFKEKPQYQEQAFLKFSADPWKNGTTWDEFLKLTNSMTEEEYERFGIDYQWAHNSSMHTLPSLWPNNFWNRGKYSLLYCVRKQNIQKPDDSKAQKEFIKVKKNTLKEGLVITVNADTVVRQLIKNYNFDDMYSPDWLHRIVYAGNACAAELVQFFPLSPKQLGVETGLDMDIQKIYIKIPNIGDNKKMLVKAMSFFGYTLANEIRDKNIKCPADEPWFIFTFIPDFQEYVTERVLKENRYLFHISPTRFKHKILEHGLCPTSKNDKVNYPPRIYMLQDFRFSIPTGKSYEFDKQLAVELAEALHRAKAPDKKVWKEYTIYKITISKMREGVRLSYDSDYYPLGVFTADNINSEALEVFYEFNIEED